MSSDKSSKKPRSTKTKADLEAKIAELEEKINALSVQTSPPPAPKPQAQQRPSPPPPPPPAAKPSLPKPEDVPTPSSSTQKEAEVAPAYATTSSTGYTGNRYYATRQRLAYHPPDKQFAGQVSVQVSRPAPPPAPEPEPERAEPEPQKQKEQRIEPPTPTVKYTGVNYYKTKQRLAYHPPDKQFIETVAIKFEEAPTVAQVETTTSSQSSSSQKKSRAEQLAEYEKEYLERIQRSTEYEKPEPAPPTKPQGTMPAGWKPS